MTSQYLTHSSEFSPDFAGAQNLLKNQLQTYAQKRNFTLPEYSCERVGPPHATRFNCKVTVNGKTYESRESFPTLNRAEQAAAKAALMSLLPNGVEEVIFLRLLSIHHGDAKICWLRMRFLCLLFFFYYKMMLSVREMLQLITCLALLHSLGC